jgi:hypothetical protein
MILTQTSLDAHAGLLPELVSDPLAPSEDWTQSSKLQSQYTALGSLANSWTSDVHVDVMNAPVEVVSQLSGATSEETTVTARKRRWSSPFRVPLPYDCDDCSGFDGPPAWTQQAALGCQGQSRTHRVEMLVGG